MMSSKPEEAIQEGRLIWHDWIDQAHVPLNETLIVEIESLVRADSKPRYRIAEFRQSRPGGPIMGRAGDYFVSERKILRWASMRFLLEVTP